MRKLLSIVTGSMILVSALLPGMASASYTPPATPAKLRYEMTQTLKTQWGVMGKLRSAESKALKMLTNAEAKKEYKKMLDNDVSNISEAYKAIREDSKNSYGFYSHEYRKNQIKSSIESFKNTIREIASLPAGANPFAEARADSAKVETDLVTVQKDILVPTLKEMLDMYANNSVKETGDWAGSAEGGFGKVSLSIDRYTSILSILHISEEVDFAAKLSYDLKATNFDYSAKDEDKITGTVSMDTNVKVIDEDVYVTIRSFDMTNSFPANLSGKKAAEEKIAALKAAAKSIEGKTFKFKAPKDAGEMNGAKTLKMMSDAVNLLTTESLLTPVRKVGSSYVLGFKVNTLIKLTKAFGVERDEKNFELDQENQKVWIVYTTQANGDMTLSRDLSSSEAIGSTKLSRISGSYRYDLNIKNPTSKSDEHVNFFLTAKEAGLDVMADGVSVQGSWKDKNLTLTVTAGSVELFSAKGALSKQNTNVAFMYNGKSVGFIQWTYDGTRYTTAMKFNFDVPSYDYETGASTTTPYIFTANGKATIETGDFPITAPTDTVDGSSFMKLLEDVE